MLDAANIGHSGPGGEFDWLRVASAVSFYGRQGIHTIVVTKRNTLLANPCPGYLFVDSPLGSVQLKSLVEGSSPADDPDNPERDDHVVALTSRRTGCQYVTNDNYRWSGAEASALGRWVKVNPQLRIKYDFLGGEFVPLALSPLQNSEEPVDESAGYDGSCPVCMYAADERLPCGHEVCGACALEVVQNDGGDQGLCPLCRAPFTLADIPDGLARMEDRMLAAAAAEEAAEAAEAAAFAAVPLVLRYRCFEPHAQGRPPLCAERPLTLMPHEAAGCVAHLCARVLAAEGARSAAAARVDRAAVRCRRLAAERRRGATLESVCQPRRRPDSLPERQVFAISALRTHFAPRRCAAAMRSAWLRPPPLAERA